MATLPHGPRVSLSADEREVIVTYNDGSKLWTVYSDSRTLRGAVLRLARQVGAEVRQVGDHGLEFEVPGPALRVTARRRARSSGASLANLRRSPRRPDSIGVPEGKLAILDGSLEGGR